MFVATSVFTLTNNLLAIVTVFIVLLDFCLQLVSYNIANIQLEPSVANFWKIFIQLKVIDTHFVAS